MFSPFGYAHMMDRVPPFAGLGVVGLVLFGLLAAAVLAVMFWALVRRPLTHPSAPTAQPVAPPAIDTARAIARERLARGEIDAEQFRAIIEALSS